MYANMNERWRGLIGTDSRSLIDAALHDDAPADNDEREKQLAVLDVLDAE